MKVKVNHILAVTFLIVSLLLFVTAVRAETLNVSGNGAGSNNELNVSSNSNTHTQQNNTVNVTNNINSSANTGGNDASGNNGNVTIKTGNATINTAVNNEFNTNKATIACCNGATPTPKTPTSVPPTATPKPDGGRGGPPGDGDGGSSQPNSGGGGPSGSTSGGSQVLGLSATSGPENEAYLFYIGGLLCLGLSAVAYRRAGLRS